MEGSDGNDQAIKSASDNFVQDTNETSTVQAHEDVHHGSSDSDQPTEITTTKDVQDTHQVSVPPPSKMW